MSASPWSFSSGPKLTAKTVPAVPDGLIEGVAGLVAGVTELRVRFLLELDVGVVGAVGKDHQGLSSLDRPQVAAGLADRRVQFGVAVVPRRRNDGVEGRGHGLPVGDRGSEQLVAGIEHRQSHGVGRTADRQPENPRPPLFAAKYRVLTGLSVFFPSRVSYMLPELSIRNRKAIPWVLLLSTVSLTPPIGTKL